jgi:hypothetical protein
MSLLSVNSAVLVLAPIIVSVLASCDTYGVRRAVRFGFVWQLEPGGFDNGH